MEEYRYKQDFSIVVIFGTVVSCGMVEGRSEEATNDIEEVNKFIRMQ